MSGVACSKRIPARVAGANYLAAIAASRLAGVKPYHTSGLATVDAKFPGWLHNGHLITLAGRPGAGKTALSQQIGEHVAGKGKSVFFFSLEMPDGELVGRSVARIGRVDAGKLKVDELTPDEEARRGHAVAEFCALPLSVYTECRTLEDILKAVVAGVKELAATGAPKLGLIVVDYVQKVEGKGLDLRAVVAGTTAAFKRLAVELDIPVLQLAQLNRNAAGRNSPRPIQSDLKDCGNIESDSDLVLYVHREDEKSSAVEVGTLKVRHVAPGLLPMVFDGQYITFKDVPQTLGQLALVGGGAVKAGPVAVRGQRAI
jgi:replicative DNA helicase